MLVLPEIKTETNGKKSPIVKVSKNDVKIIKKKKY